MPGPLSEAKGRLALPDSLAAGPLITSSDSYSATP